jgi:hypothetical protein
MDRDYVVWSIEHKSWWGPNRSGYTPYLDLAGRYTRDEAIEISRGFFGWKLAVMPDEVPVLYRDAVAMWGDELLEDDETLTNLDVNVAVARPRLAEATEPPSDQLPPDSGHEFWI